MKQLIKRFLKKIGLSDILLAAGLTGLGTGLYIEFGVGASLSVVGMILTIFGFLMAPRSLNGSN